MTKSIRRREFLGLTAAGTVGLVGASLWTKAWAAVEAPDLVFYNAKAYTVAVSDRGGHTSFDNSKALWMVGVANDTPNPFGGTFDKDGNRALNGRVTDMARSVFAKVGKHEPITPEHVRKGLAYMSKMFVRYGVMSVCHEAGDPMALQQVWAQGELLHRVSYEAVGDVLEGMIWDGIEVGFGDEWIRFGATFEHLTDGSFSDRTMSLNMGYLGVSPP